MVEPDAGARAGLPAVEFAPLEHAVSAAVAATTTTSRPRDDEGLRTTADPNGSVLPVRGARYGRPESASARHASPLAATLARNCAPCSDDGVPFPTASTSFSAPGVSTNTRAKQRASEPAT